jgi:hypothetical protein
MGPYAGMRSFMVALEINMMMMRCMGPYGPTGGPGSAGMRLAGKYPAPTLPGRAPRPAQHCTGWHNGPLPEQCTHSQCLSHPAQGRAGCIPLFATGTFIKGLIQILP